jgi:membrane AbrB-like protein
LRSLRILTWSGLIALTILSIYCFEKAGLPAARFLGPLVSAIIFSVLGFRPKVPTSLFTFAKGMLGARIAQSLGPDFFNILSTTWPYLICGTFWAMLSSCVLGIFLTRHKVMPSSTAIWGLSPGGASIMVLLSADYGADMRMVALMQYSRIVLVSLVAIFVSRFFTPIVAIPHTFNIFVEFKPYDLFITLLTSIVALYLAQKSKFSGGAIIFPMVLVALVKNLAQIDVSIPPLILLPCFISIGYRIGGNFSLADLKRCFRVYHWIILSILMMIAFCGLFAFIMYYFGNFDALTSYLSTSPGGIDVVTIIASGTSASLPFVAAMQSLRLFAVLLLGAKLAKFSLKFTGIREEKEQSFVN